MFSFTVGAFHCLRTGRVIMIKFATSRTHDISLAIFLVVAIPLTTKVSE